MVKTKTNRTPLRLEIYQSKEVKQKSPFGITGLNACSELNMEVPRKCHDHGTEP